MRRTALAAALLTAVLAVAACSQHDQTTAKGDIKNAGGSAHQAWVKFTDDPNVKKAELDLKNAGHEASKDARKAASEAKSAVHSLASDARHTGHDADRSDQHDDRRDAG